MPTEPRFAQREDLPGLCALHAVCHPTWPARSYLWWQLHPTLVVCAGDRVMGSTSMSISLPPTPTLASLGEVGYGHGISVHPDARGTGLGWTLIDARRRVLADLGLRFFIGMTQPDNGPVIEFFRRQGLTRHGDLVPAAYPDGTPGLIYMGDL